MPLFSGTRPLKRWRYVGIFCDALMACVATVQVGPTRQVFWAVLSRGEGSRLRERTHTLGGRGAVELTPGRLRVSDRGTAIDPSRPQISDRGTAIDPSRPQISDRGTAIDPSQPQISDRGTAIDPSQPQMRDGGVAIPGRLRVRDVGVAIDLALQEDAGIEALCPHGRGYVWTRKQAGIPARGTVALDGGSTRKIEALAVVDDTAGYHARVTEWWWAAGVGVDPAGRPLAFNLVEGVNDPPTGSERAVWVAGEPHEVSAVCFAADLSRIESGDGSQLRFTAEAQRSRRENLLLVRSDYRAPFGTFAGTLPGGVELAHGMGVVEHHRARW